MFVCCDLRRTKCHPLDVRPQRPAGRQPQSNWCASSTHGWVEDNAPVARARRVSIVVHANRATHANLHGVGNNVVMPLCCNLIIMSLSTGVPERQFCAIMAWRGCVWRGWRQCDVGPPPSPCCSSRPLAREPSRPFASPPPASSQGSTIKTRVSVGEGVWILGNSMQRQYS